MNILVLIKQVPDTESERKLRDSDKTLDRESVDGVMNEIDEYAVEEALLLKEAHGGTVTVMSMGPEAATDTVRKALQMGVDAGVLITDETLRGSCSVTTSRVLAKAVAGLEHDIVLTGAETTDARLGVVPAMLAEQLGVPGLTSSRKVTVDGSEVTVERITDYGYDVVKASLPAVISVVEKINEPRYPTFKGIMQAKKKQIDNKSVADLGLDPSEVGLAGTTTLVTEFAPKPPREAGEIVADEGDGGVKIANYLAAQKLV